MITVFIIVAVIALYKWLETLGTGETEWFDPDTDLNTPTNEVLKRLQNAKSSIENFLTDLATLNSQYSVNWTNNDGHYIAKQISALLIEVQHVPIESFDDKEFVKDLWKQARNISSEIFYHA